MAWSKDTAGIENSYKGSGLSNSDVQAKRKQYGYNEIPEKRAKNAIGYLHQQLQINVRTLRNGMWKILPSMELVPGDIVHVRIGDIVPADMEIVSGTVSTDESALTGESIDVTKQAGETIFSASTISHGEAIASVTAIGTKSS